MNRFGERSSDFKPGLFFRSLAQNSRTSKLKLFKNSTKNCQNSRILLSQNSIFRKNFVHLMPEMNFYVIKKQINLGRNSTKH